MPIQQNGKQRTRREKGYHAAKADNERPFPSSELGDPPPGVPKETRWIWDLVREQWPEECHSKLDWPALIGLCQWYHIWETDPDMKTRLRAWAHCAVLLPRFGMTPKDRVRVKVPKKTEEVADPMELLKGLKVVS
jgi:hypothetical protein